MFYGRVKVSFLVIFSICFGCILQTSPAQGQLQVQGDHSPTELSRWTSPTDKVLAYIGESSYGELTMDQNTSIYAEYIGIAENGGSSGLATVSNDSHWYSDFLIRVGARGNGTLNMSGGSTLKPIHGEIGTWAPGSGLATLVGTGTSWNNSGDMTVGFFTNGTLNLDNQANLHNGNFAFIGREAGGNGRVNMNNSTWTSANALVVGNWTGSTGEVNVTNASQLTTQSTTHLGEQANTSGSIHIDNSTWSSSGDIYVGVSGSGNLNVSGNSSVTTPGDLRIQLNSGSTGQLSIQYEGGQAPVRVTGAVTNNGTIKVSVDSSLTAGDYTVVESAGGFTNNGSIEVHGGTHQIVNNNLVVNIAATEMFTVTGSAPLELGSTPLAGKRFSIEGTSPGEEVLGLSFSSAVTPGTTFNVERVGAGTVRDEIQSSSITGINDASQLRVHEAFYFDTNLPDGAEAVTLTMGVAGRISLDDLVILHGEEITGGSGTSISTNEGILVGTSASRSSRWSPSYNPFDERSPGGRGREVTPTVRYDPFANRSYVSWRPHGFSSYAIATIPEPSTVMLLALASGGCLLRRRKK